MKKRIDDKILSLPPYVSTAWENVKALYLKGSELVVDLIDGTVINIPDLKEDDIEEIFTYHAAFIEKSHSGEEVLKSESSPEEKEGLPFRFAFNNMDGMDGISGAMQHNPQQANMPPLPEEMLEKISHIARIVSPEEVESLSPAHPGCNCFYCQITRAIQGSAPEEPKQLDDEIEDISEDDLHFSQWNINQIDNKLYEVTNKLDTSEHYQVFLGDPIGCTCGNPNCEHIVAVLKS
jgi:hypothetical protein